MTVVTCYVCAHLGNTLFGAPLPPRSPAVPTATLGVCYSCSVLACSEHATRAGQYQCVICQHTAAVIFNVLPPIRGVPADGGAPTRFLAERPAAAAAAAAASFRGTGAPQFALETMESTRSVASSTTHSGPTPMIVALPPGRPHRRSIRQTS